MDKFLIWERFPYAVLILAGIGIVATLLLHRTNFGKQVYAVGDNPRAAALAGINVPLVRMICFGTVRFVRGHCRRFARRIFRRIDPGR